jgi:hypothetical protein
MGLLTAFPFAASLIYSIKDLPAVLAADMPLMEIYYQGTGSYVAASILLGFFAFCMFGCVVAVGKLAITPAAHETRYSNWMRNRHNCFSNNLGHISRWSDAIFWTLESCTPRLQHAG